MKLTKHFDAFLKNKVNLSDARLERLDKRVGSVRKFIKEGDSAFAENFIDFVPQGSYAHRTIINPVGVRDDFDADVLLYVEEVHGWEAEDYVEELYKVFRASATYQVMVSRHDRCVKVDYADDFHIDVVPYMERHSQMFITNRATNEFELTNPEGYNEWLDGRDRLTHGRLIKVIRLLKYLRDYKNTFSVKSVVLSILLGNRVRDFAAWGDDADYPDVPTALRTIIGDLDNFLQANETMPSIDDPSEPTENFNHRWDQDEYSNFRDKIHTYRGWVDDAYLDEDVESSKTKWRRLFGDDFGTYETAVKKAASQHVGLSNVRDTNQEIEDIFPKRLDPNLQVRLGARLRRLAGFRTYELATKGNVVGRRREIDFSIRSINVPPPYDVYWKVRNTGQEAIQADEIRGEIKQGGSSMMEHTQYLGRHFVEVYIVKNGVCVAMDHQNVIIK